MTTLLYQGVFLQESQAQALEDHFQQLLLVSKPSKSEFEGNECLDKSILEKLWGSIKEISSKEELKHRILAFYEAYEDKSEKETLILLEVLEYLYSKSSSKNLTKILAEEPVLDFLKFSVSGEATEVVRKRAVYLMTLVAQMIKPLPSEFAVVVELKNSVEREIGLTHTGSLNSKYFLNPIGSPVKQPVFTESKPIPTSLFENSFSNPKENNERIRPEKIETNKGYENDLTNNFQNFSIGGSNGYGFSGESNGLYFSSEDAVNNIFNQLDARLDQKKYLNSPSELNSHSTGDSMGSLQYKGSLNDNSKVFFDQQYGYVQDNSLMGTNQGQSNTFGFGQTNQTQYPGTWMKGQGDQYMSPKRELQNSMKLSINTKMTDSPTMSPTRLWQQNQQLDSPGLMQGASPLLQDSNRHVLEQLDMRLLTKGVLQLEDLLEFKRLNCQKTNCPLRSFIVTQKQFLTENDMYSCPYYHNHGDRRRYPLHKNNLAKSFYVHDKLCEDCFNDPNKHKGRCYYCKNWFELFYHPKNYKLVPCQNKFCDKKPNFCPFYHHLGEKLEWDQILMNSFQYDRRNIIFSVEILRNPSNQQQQGQQGLNSPGKPNMLASRGNSQNFQVSPLQSPIQGGSMQYRQNQVQSPYYPQNYQQQQQPGSPYLQNQQQQQKQLLNLIPMQLQQSQQSPLLYNTQQYLRNNVVDYQQQNSNSPHHWGNEGLNNYNTTDNQFNQDLGMWNLPQPQNKKSPLKTVSQPFAVNSSDQIKQLFSGTSNGSGNGSPLGTQSNQNLTNQFIGFQPSIYSMKQPQNVNSPIKLNTFGEFRNPEDGYNLNKQNFEFLNSSLVEVNEKDSLIYNKPVRSNLLNQDSKSIEFSLSKGPVLSDTQKELIMRTVCGYLNGSGGQLYLGVSDEGKVVGTGMNAKEYEAFRGDIVSSLLENFSPPVDDSCYSIRRYYVLESSQQQINPTSWSNIVIEITIKSNEKVYFLKEKGKQLCYQRFEGSTIALQGDQINELFKKKMMEYMLKQQNTQNQVFSN